jgi:type IV secretion system protein VirB4
MFNLKEYKNPQRLEDRLPWAVMPAPGLVVGKTRTLSRTLVYRGNDLYSATADEIVNQAIKIFGG